MSDCKYIIVDPNTKLPVSVTEAQLKEFYDNFVAGKINVSKSNNITSTKSNNEKFIINSKLDQKPDRKTINELQEQKALLLELGITDREVGGNIKPGVAKLFESNTELAKIGSPEQYSNYLNTIFPDSKVKDIIYHGSNTKFEEFLEDNLNYFGTSSIAKGYGKNLYPVLIEINKPYYEDGGNLSNQSYEDLYDKLEQSNSDGFISNGKNLFVPKTEEQIHILGSKQDIQGFKEFVSGNQTQSTTSEEITELDILQLRNQQAQEIYEWVLDGDRNEPIGIIGVSGSGKSYMISRVMAAINDNKGIRVLGLGKSNTASNILGDESGFGNVSSTIDSALGLNPAIGITKVDSKKALMIENFDLIVIDESQMLNQKDLDDLEPFLRDKKVIFMGDPYQTPLDNVKNETGISPVFDNDYFKTPFFVLDKAVRQNETNPILSVAEDLRNMIDEKLSTDNIFMNLMEQYDEEAQTGVKYESDLEKVVDMFLEDIKEFPSKKIKIITYHNEKNRGREQSVYNINKMIASKLKRDLNDPLIADDKAVFYSHFRYSDSGQTRQFNNGEEVTVIQNSPTSDVIIVMDNKGDEFVLNKKDEHYNLQPAWAITSNKATGATFDKVYVMVNDILTNEDSEIGKANLRYLYTAITRAKESAILVSDKYDKSETGNVYVDTEYKQAINAIKNTNQLVNMIDPNAFLAKPTFTAQAIIPSKFPKAEGGFVSLKEQNPDGTYKYLLPSDQTQGAFILNTEMIDPEVLNMISYRIPSSSHASVVNLEIVGFTETGDQIIVDPTTLAFLGEDNDIDKRFVLHKYTTTDENGKIIIDNPSSPRNSQERIKKASNDVIDLITGVFQSGHKTFIENNQKILNTQIPSNTAKLLSENKESEEYALGSSVRNFDNIKAGSTGKRGVGHYSIYVKIAHSIQAFNNAIVNDDEKLKFLHIPKYGINLSGFYIKDGELFSVDSLRNGYNLKTKNVDQGSENQNNSLDNGKLQNMFKRNETEETLPYFGAFQALGIHTVKFKDVDIDYTGLFFNNKQIRELFKLGGEKHSSVPKKWPFIKKAYMETIMENDLNLNDLSFNLLFDENAQLSESQVKKVLILKDILLGIHKSVMAINYVMDGKKISITQGFDQIYDKNFVKQEQILIESVNKNALYNYLQGFEFNSVNYSTNALNTIVNALDMKTSDEMAIREILVILNIREDERIRNENEERAEMGLKKLKPTYVYMSDLKSYHLSNFLTDTPSVERRRLTTPKKSLAEYITSNSMSDNLYDNELIQRLALITVKNTPAGVRNLILYVDNGTNFSDSSKLEEAAFIKLYEDNLLLPPFQGDNEYTTRKLAIDLIKYAVLVDGFVSPRGSFVRRIPFYYQEQLGINDHINKLSLLNSNSIINMIEIARTQKKTIRSIKYRNYDASVNGKIYQKDNFRNFLNDQKIEFTNDQNKILDNILSKISKPIDFIFETSSPTRYQNGIIFININDTQNDPAKLYYNLLEEIGHSVLNENIMSYIYSYIKSPELKNEHTFSYDMGERIISTYKEALKAARKEPWWDEFAFKKMQESVKSKVPVEIDGSEASRIMYSLVNPIELYSQVFAKRPEIINFLASVQDTRTEENVLDKIYNLVVSLIMNITSRLFLGKTVKDLSLLNIIESELTLLTMENKDLIEKTSFVHMQYVRMKEDLQKNVSEMINKESINNLIIDDASSLKEFLDNLKSQKEDIC